jgi:GntR family transcriptional regulator
MPLWFSRGTEVTLREQLVTQVILSILSNDLHPGQRLPSTRELARRFRIHPNTVSAGYKQLEQECWLEFRRGSGVYVRDAKPDLPISAALALDQLIVNLFRAARGLGAPISTVRSRLRQWLELQPPDHFLLIEPDQELRQIVASEMQHAVTLPVQGGALNDPNFPEALQGGIPVVLPSKAKAARQALPAGSELITLQIRSVPSSLAKWLPAPPGALVGVASRWPDFLRLGRTMLISAGFHPDCLVLRDARKANWQRGLKETIAIVTDSVCALDLQKTSRVVVFPLLAESSLRDLRRYQDFVLSPLSPDPLP